jgi:DNA-binding MarR family transcriptional regulator
MPTYPLVSSQVIGQTESALGAIMDPILAETGSTFQQWLVLTVLAGNGGAAELGALVGRITNARKVAADVVGAAIRELTAAGFVTESAGHVTLTADGSQRHGLIRDRLTEVTGRLFGDFSAADLETAGRVLTIITERANAELTRLAS